MDPPKKWTSDAADVAREERKREGSPSSFFYSQGKALVLAARYFRNDRLVPTARGGVAYKHRHRIHLALFGQMMAALEFLFKDFVASVVDLVPTFDDAILQAKWLDVDAKQVLSLRSASSTAGSVLLHGTLGWHDAETVNKRYSALFQKAPIENSEIPDLDRLWLLRHSVAHNAGFVTAYDAVRGGMPHLADAVADVDGTFLSDSFDFLCGIAGRVAEVVGDAVVLMWLKSRVPAGKNYQRDKATYKQLKLLATFAKSRTAELPSITKGRYSKDWEMSNREHS
ncbi:MAG: hypothetical protein ACE5JR_13730 [Gemmatimonadota bacterium]